MVPKQILVITRVMCSTPLLAVGRLLMITAYGQFVKKQLKSGFQCLFIIINFFIQKLEFPSFKVHTVYKNNFKTIPTKPLKGRTKLCYLLFYLRKEICRQICPARKENQRKKFNFSKISHHCHFLLKVLVFQLS